MARTPPARPPVTALAAGLALWSLALYLGVREHAFIRFDDGCYVADNPLVRDGLTRSSFAWAWTTLRCANWHPLTWLSYLADVSLFGLEPGPMLLVNAALHAAAAALLFLALARMTRSAAGDTAWPAALAAALFALHPLRVESVAWVSERKDVLSVALGCAALLLWARYAERPSAGRYAAVAAAYAASLLAKPTLVTLPFVLLLLDAWPLRPSTPPRTGGAGGSLSAATLRMSGLGLVAEKLPLFALAAASSAVTVFAQARAGAVAGADVEPLAARLANAAVAAAAYLGKTLWPVDLAVFYPRPAGGWGTGTVLLAVATLAAATAVAVAARRRAPWLTVGWLWFLGTLVPVAGLVRVGDQAMADRYTYVPSIGLALAAAWGAAAFAGGSTARRRAATAGSLAVLAALSVATVRQVARWRDHETLFLHAVEVTGPNAWAQASLASYYGATRRPAEALHHAREAVRLQPTQPLALQNLAASLRELGRGQEALEAARAAVQAAPHEAVGWSLLGRTLFEAGAPEEARDALAKAAELAPESAVAWDDLAAAELALARPADAERAQRRALALEPGKARYWLGLGNAVGAQGRMVEAALAFARALSLEPGLEGARQNLAAACRFGGEATRGLDGCRP